MQESLADAFDRVVHGGTLAERFARAAEAMGAKSGREREAGWLRDAAFGLNEARRGDGELLLLALRVPELQGIRDEGIRRLQGAAVEALEEVSRVIVRVGGERSPLVEVLFRGLKTALLPRAGREAFEEVLAEVERRLATSYVQRMLADADHAPVAAQVETFRAAVAKWASVFVPCEEDEAEAVRRALRALAERLEEPVRQARFLAEAAFVGAPEEREGSGIFDKPKRRAGRKAQAAESEVTDDARAATPPSNEVEAALEG